MEGVIIVYALVALAGWALIVRRAAATGAWRLPHGGWHAGDDAFAGLMAAYFLLVVFAGSSAERDLKPADINATIINCGFMLLFVVAVIQIIGKIAPRGTTLTSAFGFLTPRPLRACAMGAAGLLLTWPVVQLAVIVATRLGATVSENDDLVRYFREHTHSGELVPVIVLAAVAAPIFEEFVFRGYLYGVMKRHAGGLWSALTTALLFAAIHQNPPAIPAYMILSLGLTLVYELSGSLWAPIIMHALFNSVSIVGILWFPEWNL